MQDKHDENMTPQLREELRMNSIIASLAELTPEEREHEIQNAKRTIESYHDLIARDPELKYILIDEK